MEEIIPKAKTTARQGTIPRTDNSLRDLALSVMQKWEANPQLTLQWTDFNSYKTTANAYAGAYTTTKTKDAERDPITMKLNVLDKKITDNSGAIKIYLQDKYGKKAAPAYFPAFGFEYNKRGWKIPADRGKRTDCLKWIVDAVQTEGFSDKTCGLAFWTALRDEYILLVNQAGQSDGNISELIAQKNQVKILVVKHLNALIHLIKANYPDDAAARLRDWGFQKEKY